MIRTRRSLAALAVACASLLLAAGPATAKRPPPPPAPPAPVPAPAPAPLPAPTNLRLTAVAPTSVTLEWDSVVVGQPGCSLPYVFFFVFDDGVYLVTTPLPIIGPSTRQRLIGLMPGTTHRFQVQGRDNCTGAMSPLSEPLVVTTPLA